MASVQSVMTIFDELRAACPSVVEQEPLARHTSWAIGGPADFFATVRTRGELGALRKLIQQKGLPVFFIGAGSNLLVSDRGIRGLVIHLDGEFRLFTFSGTQVVCGAAVWMPVLAKQSAERGLAGLESLIGVPGTVGGGLVMNAGTRDGVLGDTVQSVEVLEETGEPRLLSKASLDFSYRHSALATHWVLGATLQLTASTPAAVQGRMNEFLQYRTRTQPLATSNCGSVFKNPVPGSAGRLVEEAGLKGFSHGGARVSDRHANFILNENKATAEEIRALMRHIQETVEKKSGVRLEPEVKFVGDWGASHG